MKTEPDYEITDLTEEHLPAFCSCLMPDDRTMKEAGSLKAVWCRKKFPEGFGAKLARLQNGCLAGMIQYVPADDSPADGKDLYFVHCIWIPPAKRSSGLNLRRKGIGSALLRAVEEEVNAKGAAGLAVWGTPLPFFLRSAWYRKQGYLPVDRSGMQELLWKPFRPDAEAPKWRKTTPPDPASFTPGKVTISCFSNGICPAMNAVHQRFRRAAEAAGEKVELKIIDTSDPEVLRKWGQTDAVYINDREFSMGPPPSCRKIRKALNKAVKKL